MRKRVFLLILGISVVLKSCCYTPGCGDDSTDDIVIEPSFSQYEPIYLDKIDFENSIHITDPITITTSGKIYLQNDLLFINEFHKGFHIYDNSDPTSPIPVKFLEVPGSTDISIRDQIIYINQATDLIALEYNSENQEISLAKRISNVFPELISPDGYIPYSTPENSVIVGWKLIN
ncbi:hypothetical protein [Aquimarina pacifica]|uniref:hypothetical protein n=1 Tax=Aquimarina pacifica TaxID=1296415 RepID=UPI00047199D6|nr:hypothetical protein [Aquimarina pacifica]